MLYPKKNLIKGFSSYVPNGVFVQQMYEEYRVQAKSTSPTTSNGYWLVDVKPFTDYTFSLDRPSNMDIGVFNADATKTIVSYKLGGDVSFNSGVYSQVRCYVRGSVPNDIYELGKPMLKEGGSDIFEPYQLTNKRAVMTPNKNIYDKLSVPFEKGAISSASGTDQALDYVMRTKGLIPVKPNTTYVFEKPNGLTQVSPYPFDSKQTYLGNTARPSLLSVSPTAYRFTTASDCFFIRFQLNHPSTSYNFNDAEIKAAADSLQIEEGLATTPFEPYQIANKRALLRTKKNLLPKMSEWTNTNAQGKLSFPKDYRLEMNGDTAGLFYNQHTVVEPGKTYTISAGYLTANARVAIREVKANGSKVFVSNLIPSQMSYTVKPALDTVKIEVDCTTNGSGMMVFENIQLEEGSTATPFEPYQLANKRAVQVPKKNLVPTTEGMLNTGQTYTAAPERIMFPMGWSFNGTEFVTVKSPYEFELTAVQNNRDIRVVIPVKPLTVYKPSCETNGDAHVFFLDKTKTVPLGQAYNTISAPYTITTPAGCEYVAFAMTNRGLGAGKFNFKNWQLEEVAKAGDPATAFEPFQLTNKRAVLYPAKNFILPFDQWTLDDGVTINFIERTPSRIVMDLTAQNAYRGFRMPVDWNVFKQLLGKDVTLSVKSIENTGGTGQLQLRFYGGASGNTDFVLNGTGAVSNTKKIPDDATQAFLVYQVNSPRTLRMSLDLLQLEIGKAATDYEPYRLGNKRA